MASVDNIQSGYAAPNASGFFGRLATTIEHLNEFRAKRAVYRQTVRELNELSDRDLADLGLHRSSIRSVAREAAYGAK
ncbi:DUF1127 domain-containing protein [Paracoccus pacificus]|uniref:DUF1127 domain-containing protein n=1 Tax=Paracoccus pacificus TaxID=1463598 RepID=A0ABW4R7W8_9RHOB